MQTTTSRAFLHPLSPFTGIEPTGQEVEVEGVVILRVEDGQLAEAWSQADMMGLMRQLGVVELPER